MSDTDDFLIRATGVSLDVPVFLPGDRSMMTNPARFITDLYLGRTQRGISTLLKDINLDVMPGERIGILGVNGAGKSTLMRLLAGIYRPTRGTLTQRGSIKGLFDISLGMNPEATGLENIYMRGLQMGMTMSGIKDMIPDILEFSELADAIEKPLNTYSTGMRLRLAVSISTTITPDVLLLDEWIGTGDVRFRDKLHNRMERIITDSKGLVLATHNLGLMKSFCNRGIVLHQGEVLLAGELSDAIRCYQELVESSKKS